MCVVRRLRLVNVQALLPCLPRTSEPMMTPLLLTLCVLAVISFLLTPRQRTVEGFYAGQSADGSAPSMVTLVFSQSYHLDFRPLAADCSHTRVLLSALAARSPTQPTICRFLQALSSLTRSASGTVSILCRHSWQTASGHPAQQRTIWLSRCACCRKCSPTLL